MKLRHILRDSKKVVDHIDKEARSGMEQLIIHVDPLVYVRDLLEKMSNALCVQ